MTDNQAERLMDRFDEGVDGLLRHLGNKKYNEGEAALMCLIAALSLHQSDESFKQSVKDLLRNLDS